MIKHKLFTAVTLSFALAMSSVAYANPGGQNVQIVNSSQGPSEGAPTSEAPGESAAQASQSSGGSSSEAKDPSQTTSASAENVAAPTVQAEGAVLLDAATGTVLYGKNENTQFYPASITKLMTALLTVENCSLGDTVTFSKTATTNLESGSVTLNLTEGDTLSVENCLYALLLKSANEVANGLAEKVSGSVAAFADKMNARAKELGCENTHFVNPNGLNNQQHLTTPYDMALIARAAYANDTIRKISSTTSYTIPATKKSSSPTKITMGHKMLYSTDSRYYPGIIGGKTGYTSKAGNTLVTAVEKDGVRLIAVVMKCQGTHYDDTKALLDYGFANRDRLLAAGGSAPANNSQGGPASNPSGGSSSSSEAGRTEQWGQDGNKRYYIKADGTRAAGEWMTIGEKEYWFDEDGTAATGWRSFTNGDWYYFEEDGAMAKNKWVQNVGKWFYLGSTGAMLKNTVTPDGFQVDEAGARI